MCENTHARHARVCVRTRDPSACVPPQANASAPLRLVALRLLANCFRHDEAARTLLLRYEEVRAVECAPSMSHSSLCALGCVWACVCARVGHGHAGARRRVYASLLGSTVPLWDTAPAWRIGFAGVPWWRSVLDVTVFDRIACCAGCGAGRGHDRRGVRARLGHGARCARSCARQLRGDDPVGLCARGTTAVSGHGMAWHGMGWLVRGFAEARWHNAVCGAVRCVRRRRARAQCDGGDRPQDARRGAPDGRGGRREEVAQVCDDGPGGGAQGKVPRSIQWAALPFPLRRRDLVRRTAKRCMPQDVGGFSDTQRRSGSSAANS